KEPTHDDEEANLQRALELSLKKQGERTQGSARPVVIREPDSGRIKPLPEVQGKGKEKRRTPMPTEPSEHPDSPYLDAELDLTDNETESEEEVPVILKEPASSIGTLSSLQNLDKDISFTDQFFMEKPQEEEPWKTNVEAESQSDSPFPTSTATTSTITTRTTLLPPPPQSTTDLILVRRIGELEQHILDLIQNNLALEERLDKHGSRLYKLENLNIPHQVSKVVDEIVNDTVDWAMQALL
ncbi:retrovirus-related pol polyprotein from transposon TNT 1-94, partial [Tanacetum coccineum]